MSIDETTGTPSPAAEKRCLEFVEAAVTDVVQRVREGLNIVRPAAILSVCTNPLPKPVLSPQGRNAWLWLDRGLIDLAYDMDYYWTPNFGRLNEVRTASTKPDRYVPLLGNFDKVRRHGRFVVTPRNAEQVARLVDYALRKYPANGVALYLYSSLDDAQIEALRQGPFKENAIPHWDVVRR